MQKRNIRLEDNEYAIACVLAKQKGMTFAEFVREALTEKIQGQSVVSHVSDASKNIEQMLEAFRSELSRVQFQLTEAQARANNELALDLEKKLGEEVDDQREMLVQMFTRFAQVLDGQRSQGSLGERPTFKNPFAKYD